MPPLESSHTFINSPAWHPPQHPLLSPPPTLAHQTQAEALIFFAACCSQHVCFPCGRRLIPSLPTSHCRVAARQPQPCWAVAPPAPQPYNLTPQGISGREMGAVHKPTLPEVAVAAPGRTFQAERHSGL